MSDQTSIFNGNTNTETPPNTSVNSNNTNANSENDFTTLLGSIKNEAGLPKYKDTAEALNGLKHAQEYIPQLKGELSNKDRELETLRNEVLRLKTVEETVLKLTERQENAGNTNPAVFDEQKLADMISRTLSQKETEASQKANLSSVVSALQQSFGADAEKTFYSKAAEMGMTVAQINALAATSPSAALTLLGVKGKVVPQEQKPQTSGVNTSGFQPQQETFVSRNTVSTSVGATSSELMNEHRNSKKMVEELHAQGVSVHDLSDPKKYFQYFNK
jgi:hypothetical protein